jgi:hypothetical protein
MIRNYKAQSYCFKNDIKIYYIYINKNSIAIEVNFKGELAKSDISYTSRKAEAKVWELYEYFYNKRDEKE